MNRQNKSWAYGLYQAGLTVVCLGLVGFLLTMYFDSEGISERRLSRIVQSGAASSLNPLDTAAVYIAAYKIQLLLIGGIGMLAGYSCRQPGDFPKTGQKQSKIAEDNGPQESRVVRVETGELAGNRYLLKDKLVIGRNPRSCNVVFEHFATGVSREHCTVRLQGTVVTVTDEGSRYGTYIDGVRVKPGQSAVWHRGQTLKVGVQVLTLHSR